MEILAEKDKNIMVLSLSGKLDGITSITFEERITGMIESGEHFFIVELQEVDYISSAGLRVFLRMVKKLNELSGKIVLCSLQAQVKEVFEVAGFASFFQITTSKEEALTQFEG